MIELIQFPRDFGMPNNSPYCMRVESFLKLAEIPYELDEQPDPRKFPKGKLPAIRDGQELICDSSFILKYLTEKYDVKLDEGMSEEQKAIAHSLTRMLLESFYWVISYGRFADMAGWPTFRAAFIASMPPVIGPLLANLVRGNILKQQKAQGLGRHSLEEVGEIGRGDVDAMAALLGSQDFFFGDQPRSFDATAFAFLANVAYVPADTLTRKHLLTRQNLLDYCERMKARCFPEIMTATLPG